MLFFIIIIFCLWSLERYRIGQICGGGGLEDNLPGLDDLHRNEARGSIPAFFHNTRCQITRKMQPLISEQLTKYTFDIFNDFFRFITSVPGGSSIVSVLGAIAPGVLFTKLGALFLFFYQTMTNEMSFSNSGFQNRVSITINTLEEIKKNEEEEEEEGVGEKKGEKKKKKKKNHFEFEMRTIRDCSLSELIPNKAAQRAIKAAGRDVELNESGPIEFFESKQPCLSCHISWFQKYLCCIRTRNKNCTPGGCCCCFHRCNNVACGTSSSEKYCCDPILRFSINPSSIKMKDFVQDQIKNVLSESTSGSHFMGWEMGSSNYQRIKYCWALTYEQSLDPKKSNRNRKFRILVAQRALVDFAAKNKKAWEIFRNKSDHPYTMYCDRRWSHLRKMGLILNTKEDPNIPKNTLARLNSFFIGDDLEVVSPIIQGEHCEGQRLELLIKKWKTFRDGGGSGEGEEDQMQGRSDQERSNDMHSLGFNMNDFEINSILSPRNSRENSLKDSSENSFEDSIDPFTGASTTPVRKNFVDFDQKQEELGGDRKKSR